jgi:hypothetical protein
MLVEYIDNAFRLEFSSADQKKFVADIKRLSKINENSKLYEGTMLNNMAHIISQAKAEKPMGNRIIHVDTKTVEVLNDIAHDMVCKGASGWMGVSESIKSARSSIIESKIPSIRTILEQVKQEYSYRIKTVVDLNDEQLSSMEQVLEKYELLDVVGPNKTILQKQPLDFPEIRNAEVFIYDVKTYLPISAYVLQQELRAVLGIPESFIVVRSENDPLEIETARAEADYDFDEEETDDLTPASLLDTAIDYPESTNVDPTDFYGDKYNANFLGKLAQISATRKVQETPPDPSLFGWLHPKKSDTQALDFNKDIPNAPTPVYKWSVDTSKPIEMHPSINDEGCVDDNFKTFTRVYKDKDGNIIKKTKDIKHPIRKE